MRDTRARERDILSYIGQYVVRHKIPPTIREIAKGCYMSLGQAHRYVSLLESGGKIVRQKNISRSIQIKY